MEADISFWTKVAAIGQVLGATATFLAVIVALQLARSERQLRVRVTAQLGTIVNAIESTDVVSVTVQNVGLRAAKIDGFGWIGGFPSWSLPKILRWLIPKWLQQRTLYQVYDYSWAINEKFPWRLQPGESKSSYIRRSNFFDEFVKKEGETFFRRVPLTTLRIAVRPRVFAAIDTQPITTGRIAKPLLREMRKAHQSALVKPT